MRITNNMLIGNMLNNMRNNFQRFSKLQTQMSTGKKIEVPSDDPIIASRALKLRTDVAEIQQYQRNAKDALSWMELTESTIGNMNNMFQRMRELAVQASNGSNTPDDLNKIKQEISEYKNQMVQFSNTTYAGRYIFSGYKTDKALMDENGDFAIDVSMGEEISYELGSADSIIVNSLGSDLFNGGNTTTTGTQGQTMTLLNDFMSALDTADFNGLTNLIGGIDEEMKNMMRVRSLVGAKVSRLELTIERLSADNLNFTSLMAENEDVDMAEVIMNFNSEQNVYNASLSGGSKVIQPSLVDFLR